MTLEQRLDHVEQQNERILQKNHRIERKNKRLTTALTMTVVAMCAAVTVAATGEKYGVFDVVKARSIWVTNDAGEIVVSLGANSGNDGWVVTQSAEGKALAELGSTANGNGTVNTYRPIR